MIINWREPTKSKAKNQETFRFGWATSQLMDPSDQVYSSGFNARWLPSVQNRLHEVVDTATWHILDSLMRASSGRFKDTHALGRILLDAADKAQDPVSVELKPKRNRGTGQPSAWTTVLPELNTNRGGSNVLLACHKHVHEAREKIGLMIANALSGSVVGVSVTSQASVDDSLPPAGQAPGRFEDDVEAGVDVTLQIINNGVGAHLGAYLCLEWVIKWKTADSESFSALAFQSRVACQQIDSGTSALPATRSEQPPSTAGSSRAQGASSAGTSTSFLPA